MSKRSGRALILVLLVAVLALALGAPATSAATLTSGTFTYVVGGEETVFPYDPIVKKDGYLLPVDVLTSFGVSASNPQQKDMTLTRGDVTVSLSLGRPWATLKDGTVVNLAPVPMRVGGRVFLPVQIFSELSIDVQPDAQIITLRDLAPALTGVTAYTDQASYNAARAPLTVSGMVKATEGQFLNLDATYLTPALAASPALTNDAGTRARLVRLMDTNSLLLVHLKNSMSSKALTFSPATVYLMDQNGQQYDFTGSSIDLQGSLGTKILPNVDKYSVLIFSKVSSAATALTVYLDSNPSTMTGISLPKP